jgi:hypothetical protein
MADMNKIRTVCVYCGSGPGTNPRFVEAARDFGKILAESGIGLVYGGGALGLMGAVAAAVIDHGGNTIGIIPEFLATRERINQNVSELIVTTTMHERKQIMFERADAFVALPGGIGTLEELVEQLTWAQLARHQKPIVILNIDDFWSPLLELFEHLRSAGFIHSESEFRYSVTSKVHDILPSIQAALQSRRPEIAASANVKRL